MAKVKSLWLRNAKQRLGGAVTYVLKGQQVVRELAATVSNPRTTAQMQQRVRLANLVQFYKRMRSWAKQGAFQSKKQTWSDYNAFVSANIGLQVPYLTKQQSDAGACVVAPYVVSKGSLNPVSAAADNVNRYFVSNIAVNGTDDDTAVTIGAFSASIINSNNNILDGDQISCIVAIQRTENGLPYVIMRAYELTLDLSDTRIANVVYPWIVTRGDAEGENWFLAHSFDDTVCGCAFIVSRKSGGNIAVSSASLVLNDAANRLYATYTTSTQQAIAIASYGESTENFLDPETRGDSSTAAAISGYNILQVKIGNTTYNAGQGGPVISSARASNITLYFDNAPSTAGNVEVTIDFFSTSSTVVASPQFAPNAENSLQFSVTGNVQNDDKRFKSIKAAFADGKVATWNFAEVADAPSDPGDVTP